MAISAMLTVVSTAPAPPQNDPNLKVWDGPADIWFAPETPTEVLNKAAWAIWQNARLIEYHNMGDNGT